MSLFIIVWFLTNGQMYNLTSTTNSSLAMKDLAAGQLVYEVEWSISSGPHIWKFYCSEKDDQCDIKKAPLEIEP